MSDPDDRALVARVIERDETAFRLLFRRYGPAMYALAFRMVGRSPADAEDAVQEAWLRAVRGLASFRFESAVRTWLLGIVINCSLEICRRRERTSGLDPDQMNVGSLAHWSAEALDLERAVAALASGYRHVLVLHDIYGFTHGEIAARLGIDEGTSKSQLSRARGVIRRTLSIARTEGRG